MASASIRLRALCTSCGTECKDLCSGCRSAAYCGASCQMSDWTVAHANECDALRERAARPGAAEYIVPPRNARVPVHPPAARAPAPAVIRAPAPEPAAARVSALPASRAVPLSSPAAPPVKPAPHPVSALPPHPALVAAREEGTRRLDALKAAHAAELASSAAAAAALRARVDALTVEVAAVRARPIPVAAVAVTPSTASASSTHAALAAAASEEEALKREVFRAKDELERHGQCAVCESQPRTILTLPCKHLALCKGCHAELAKASPPPAFVACPRCRASVRAHHAGGP